MCLSVFLNTADGEGLTVQLVGGVHHRVGVSIGVADEVHSILLAEQGSAGSACRGQASDISSRTF